MSALGDLRSYLIAWNNKYPLDRIYRKKYNIGFASPKHKALNQIDIYADWLEDRLYEEAVETAEDNLRKEKEFEKGVWLRDSVDAQDIDEWALFDKIDVSKIISQQVDE